MAPAEYDAKGDGKGAGSLLLQDSGLSLSGTRVRVHSLEPCWVQSTWVHLLQHSEWPDASRWKPMACCITSAQVVRAGPQGVAFSEGTMH